MHLFKISELGGGTRPTFDFITSCALDSTSDFINVLLIRFLKLAVAFRIYDIDNDGYISNGELFQVLKMMVGNNLKDTQLQQIVDKTIIYADKDGDGRISFEEFSQVSRMEFLY